MKILIIDNKLVLKNTTLKKLKNSKKVEIWLYKNYNLIIHDNTLTNVKFDVVIFNASTPMIALLSLLNGISYKTIFYITLDLKSSSSFKKLNEFNTQFNIHFLPFHLNESLIKKIILDYYSLKPVKTFTIYVDKELKVLDVDAIIYIKAEGDYVNIITNYKKYLIYSRLKEILNRIKYRFVQSNRSYLINVIHIDKVGVKDVLLSNGDVIPLSKNMRKRVIFETELHHL